MRTGTGAKPATIDQYLAGVSDDKRAALQRLRETILGVIPTAEECISYGMPAFRYEGKVVVFLGAAANHCAFYPGGMVNEFADELEAFETSKGTIRFQPDHPLPAALVRKIVKAAVARNAKSKPKSTSKRRGKKKSQ
jgi:uncharacterized protein YdhG (YjbR/CyaY superfamily)